MKYLIFIYKIYKYMSVNQPKKHIEKLTLKDKSYGKERRRNATKKILEHGTPFPKGVSYKDIDNEFIDFVKEKLKISYDGELLPTFTLFSNQKISEYSQTWKYVDSIGNLILNFKTVTRDNTPNKGTQYGDLYNIPGNRDYTMFTEKVIGENGQISYDVYTMKQPMPIDFLYTINIITNKYELLNEFNELVNYQFKALQCYIFPNNHAMSLILDSVSDESEYTLNDRKFYSQSYNIKLRGYIVRQEDFQVKHIPSRIIILTEGDKYSHKNNNSSVLEEVIDDPCKVENIDNRYYYKTINYKCFFRKCEKEIKFIVNTTYIISNIITNNVYDFAIYVNEEYIDVNEATNVEITNGDEVKILIERDDETKDSSLEIIGFDKNVIIDRYKNDAQESSLDEISDNETKMIKN